jgi:hypothetical protein
LFARINVKIPRDRNGELVVGGNVAGGDHMASTGGAYLERLAQQLQ